MLKLLFAPIRLATGWGVSPRLVGWIGITMLVLLRMTIGWHFFSEGIDKYRTDNWSAAPFFANAKGPFAGEFRKLVWDAEGEIRLNRDRMESEWTRFTKQVYVHYGYDEAQKRLVVQNLEAALEQYDNVVSANATDISDFEIGRERIRKMDEDPIRSGVASLKGQKETVRSERQALIRPIFSQIDAITEGLERSQNQVASQDQRNSHAAIGVRMSPTMLPDTSVIDDFVPYFDMAIGWCLLLGLFTPVAALAAAGFLGSVFLSQFPPTTGPSSSMYQLIEGMACLVLAGTAAGRFAGLDFFLHMITRRLGRPKNASAA